jgi:hypothetical protein
MVTPVEKGVLQASSEKLLGFHRTSRTIQDSSRKKGNKVNPRLSTNATLVNYMEDLLLNCLIP